MSFNSNKKHLRLPIKQILFDTVQLLKNEWISECKELLDILQTQHLQSLLFTADCVARGVYDHDYIDFLLKNLTDGQDGDTKQALAKSFVITKKRKLPSQKLIRVFKSHEPLGVTVRFDQTTGDIVLSRVLVGGAAYRSGLVNVGDRILEVNGISLRGRSHLDVINILQKECLKTMITFRMVVCKSNQLESTVKSYIVKAHFDYDPNRDPYIPCNNIGLAFTKGTLLTVLNRDDPDWWQACREVESGSKPRMEIFQIAGLIPSKQLQERRIVAIRDIRSRLDQQRFIHILGSLLPIPFKKSKWSVQKVRRIMYDLNDCINYDREEIHTYEPVVKYFPKAQYNRPVVLTGPTNVGCTTLIRMVLNYRPNRYREPLAHTTRFKRFAETEGVDFYFVSEQWMQKEIDLNNFVCYSKYKSNYYGLHKTTIQQIINSGCVCIFKMDAKFLRVVHNSELKPFVIFISPPSNVQQLIESRLKNFNFAQSYRSRGRFEYEMYSMICEGHKMHYLYGPKFDATVINHELQSSFKILYEILVSVENEPKWVPLSWVSKHA